jgi:hypothetical protein
MFLRHLDAFAARRRGELHSTSSRKSFGTQT